MALVGVVDLRHRRAGEAGVGADGAHAADAEQHLLAQAVLGVAAVEPVGDVTEVLGVLLDVGVHQQQRHASDLGDPDAHGQGLAVGQPEGDLRDGVVGLAQQRERQAVGVEDGVGLLLPAVARERLPEVAVAVEQPDADDRDAEVARGLEVVAGQDAETAGVLRQHRRDAELRGEVADRAGRGLRGGRHPLVPPVAGEVLLEVRAGRGQALEERRVGGELVEAALGDRAEHPHRVVGRGGPGLGVDGGEQVLCLRVPRPAEVAGQLSERGQGGGQHGTDGESANGSHGRTVTQEDLNDPMFAGPTRA